MLTLVVARHTEDVSWLNELPSETQVWLYNKGPLLDPSTLPPQVRMVTLPNVGRESDTYLHHLMLHSAESSDADFTVFTQADPFEHAPQFLALLHHVKSWSDVQPLSVTWKVGKEVPPVGTIERERAEWIGDLAIRREQFHLKTWAPVSFTDDGAKGLGTIYRGRHMLDDDSNLMAHFLCLIGLMDKARQAALAREGNFAYGAIFAVRNMKIREFLTEAAHLLAEMRRINLSHPVYGYFLERTWLHLFGEPFRSD